MEEGKKIVIAIDNDFIREAYYEVFKKEGFAVLETKEGKDVLEMIKKEKPDIILLDVLLSGMSGFEVMSQVKADSETRKIPVIIFAQLERKEDKDRAIELEAKDFITAAEVSPVEVIRRVKIALGEQKSYNIEPKESEDLKELMADLRKSQKCPKCGSAMILHLIRDLARGKNEFILSFVCPKCDLKK